MLQNRQIKQAIRQIVSVAKPDKIILFGSYARRKATQDSDLDLLVIKRGVSKKKGQAMVLYRHAVGSIGIGVDILVTSPKEVKEKSKWCSSPIYWAVREGKVLYDSKQGSKGSSKTRISR
ncbi:MAG: nucleotidyltransferase domain-containing protein [Gammaproteobacteria bacterium]|nr:nucleotidyltransferase domain-containing protein [Gammaproteobacteria bacterium]